VESLNDFQGPAALARDLQSKHFDSKSLKPLIDHAPIGVLILNTSAELIFTNAALVRLIQYAEPEFGTFENALQEFIETLWKRRLDGVWMMRINPGSTENSFAIKVTCHQVPKGDELMYLVLPEKLEAKPVWQQESLLLGHLRLDTKSVTAYWGRKQLQLSPTEFRLLVHLAEHQGTIWNQDKLLRKVWGQAATETRKVDVFIGKINKQIQIAGGPSKLIQNRRGLGYVLIYQ
jgi:hypothetical protein